IAALNARIPVETEVFAFGGMCVMAEGRCSLSSYVTGQSPNTDGVCSPASHVRYEKRDGNLISRLGDYTLNMFSDDEAAGYPTLCKGRFVSRNEASYLFEEPASLNVLSLLPELAAAGVSALKIEGRQRGRAYVSNVVSVFRDAVDAAARGDPIPTNALDDVTEGGRGTTGAFEKQWQ
ncbi:MAG: U32 family peptidase, partial [Rhodospirillales bacterium]|nr:U32 family peptidase [Rhodospirillales bacterium]